MTLIRLVDFILARQTVHLLENLTFRVHTNDSLAKVLESCLFWQADGGRHGLVDKLIDALQAKEINHILSLFRVIANVAECLKNDWNK